MTKSKFMQSMRRKELNEECRQMRMNLPDDLLGELDEGSSSILYQHVSQCRSCLEAYLALQTAADIAGLAR